MWWAVGTSGGVRRGGGGSQVTKFREASERARRKRLDGVGIYVYIG